MKGYFYIDAFAGSGYLKIRKEREKEATQHYLIDTAEYEADDLGKVEYIKGSPRVALEIEHPFTDYVFIELDRDRVTQLEKLKKEAERPDRRVHIRQKDCNAYLIDLLKDMQGQWREWRGVVFLDPFGMQAIFCSERPNGSVVPFGIMLNLIEKMRDWTIRSRLSILVHRRRERGQGDARHDCPTIARGDGASDRGATRAPALG